MRRLSRAAAPRVPRPSSIEQWIGSEATVLRLVSERERGAHLLPQRGVELCLRWGGERKAKDKDRPEEREGGEDDGV